MALDGSNLAGERMCCSAGGAGAGSSQALRNYLNRVTAPIAAMSLMAQTASQSMADEILMLRSTAKLQKNMCAAGRTKPEFGCWHPHHIVGVAAIRYPSVAASQAILANFGMSIDDANNGVWLECSKHIVLHTNVYHDAVFAAIQTSSSYVDLAGRLRIIAATLSARGTYP